MNLDLLKVSLRQRAVYIPKERIVCTNKSISEHTLGFLMNIKKLGYTVSEELLHVLDLVTPSDKLQIYDFLNEVTGMKLNWTPLVKGWDIPTGESREDHAVTFYINAWNVNVGIFLPCGHWIPENTFPLERYNGCPFCGVPFLFGKIGDCRQGSKLKILELWTEDDLNRFFKDLLESRTALDATQVDSLKILIEALPLPEVVITMKETMMLVLDVLVEKGKPEKARSLFSTPNDILRYLWYKKTGFLQIVEPKTIIRRVAEK